MIIQKDGIMKRAEKLVEKHGDDISYGCHSSLTYPRDQSLHSYMISLYLDDIGGMQVYLPCDWSGKGELKNFLTAVNRIGKIEGKEYHVTDPITPHSVSTMDLRKRLMEIATDSNMPHPENYSIRELQTILAQKKCIQPNSELTMNPGFDQVEDGHRALGTNVKDFVYFLKRKVGDNVDNIIIFEDWGNSYAAPFSTLELLDVGILTEGLRVGKVYIFPLRERRGHVGNPALVRESDSKLIQYTSAEGCLKFLYPNLYKKLANGAVLEKLAVDVPDFAIPERQKRIFKSDHALGDLVAIHGHNRGAEERLYRFLSDTRYRDRLLGRTFKKLSRVIRGVEGKISETMIAEIARNYIKSFRTWRDIRRLRQEINYSLREEEERLLPFISQYVERGDRKSDGG